MKTFFSLAVLLFSFIATAGPVFIGNGGNAIRIADRFYVLDLAEQGIAEEPNFKRPINDYYYQYYWSRVTAYQNRIPAATLELFSEKLAEIAELDPVYSEALVTAFENVRWMFINYRLTDIPVESIIAGPYYQAAARTNDVVLFDNLYWMQMDEKNHVALIFHELNYILIQPQAASMVYKGKLALEKSAFKARLQNGYLFTKNLEFIDPADFSKRIDQLFPSRFDTEFRQFVFYPFVYKTKTDAARMAFSPYILINGSMTGPRLANMSLADFKQTICESTPALKTAEIVALSVQQDVFNGDNNSQDSTSYVETKIPGFTFNRLRNESCSNEAQRLFNEISSLIPGVFYNK